MGPSSHRRRRVLMHRLRRRLRSSFLIVPFLGILSGYLLATGAVWTDEWIHDLNDRLGSVQIDELLVFRLAEDLGESAKAALATMSSAMLTFLGVVFSITLVALQMAAGQLTPRVLRIYVESWVTKTTLAVFLCTFLYTLRLQKEYAKTDDPEQAVVPYVGASLAMFLVVGSLMLFVVYVHTTIAMMRPTHVMDRVTAETLRLAGSSGPYDQEPDDDLPERVGALDYAGPPGVLQSIRVHALIPLAARHGTVLRLIPRIGDFLAPGTPLFEAHGGRLPPSPAVHKTLDIGGERTPDQDLVFGLRQLADIAARALSPGVNDPTTATQALDRIQVVLAAFADQPLGRARHRDRDGRVRLVETEPSWDELVDMALTEIRTYGAGSVQVTRRLAALLADLEAAVPASRRGPLARHRALLEEAVSRAVPATDQRAYALTPDRQGTG